MKCSRCFRNTHTRDDCYAKKTLKGKVLSSKTSKVRRKKSKKKYSSRKTKRKNTRKTFKKTHKKGKKAKVVWSMVNQRSY